MNVILIVNDTFRRDHLGCYGSFWIKTPNLEKFAQRAAVFEQCYTASYPTVPHRLHDRGGTQKRQGSLCRKRYTGGQGVGYFLDMAERLGLFKNTLIIWTTDHGHLFGEHNLQGEPGAELGTLYEVTTRIPLLVHHPEGLGAGKRITPHLADDNS